MTNKVLSSTHMQVFLLGFFIDLEKRHIFHYPDNKAQKNPKPCTMNMEIKSYVLIIVLPDCQIQKTTKKEYS